MKNILREELENLRQKGTHRVLRAVSSPQGREITLDGQRALNFCSNDYLGLAGDVRLQQAAEVALEHSGFGSGASRLVCGNMGEHALLERAIADHKKTESALLFSSGYMANAGIISSLCSREDVVLSDRLNHASITDGIILSRAEMLRYAHNDVAALEEKLKACQGFRRRLIVTDAVFSMDGDIAPLREIVALAEKYDAWLMVDEAHAYGVFGATGAGLVEELGLQGKIPIQMGTLSKAAGGFGAYCAGSAELIEYLVNASRSFIFTTALPPAVAAGCREAVRIIQDEPARRELVRSHAGALRLGLREMGFDTLGSVTPIIPVMMGESERAVRFSRALLKEGIFVSAIRPPTVPANTARLRVTVSAAHTQEDLARCLEAFHRVRDKEGF
jgi:8-amino-7-oxononanoate synthase